MSTSILEWTSEPVLPLGYAEEDDWFLTEDEEKQNGLDGSFSSLTRKEIAQQLLEDIDNLVKEENKDTFSEWFEDKINLPIFEEIEPILPTNDLKSSIEEFRDLDQVLNGGNLTPPQSPNNPEIDSYVILDCLPTNQSNNVLTDENYVVLLDDYQVFTEEESSDCLTAPPTPVQDLEKELAVVDELIRSTAQRLEYDSSNSQSSSSDCIDSSVNGVDEESDDPEWIPSLKTTIGRMKRRMKRARPYEKDYNQEDRLLRKKEQNKNAATRYRQKKKAEVSEILEEERKLEEEKKKLKLKVADIQMEIKYIKGLMRDLFKAKGLLIN